jgi:adenosylcobinamide kinase / adenosylcobinamide-phosphate guanylyltransferase
MGKLTFILGGARSGKSAYAQQLALRAAGDAVLYVATLRETTEVAQDAEMQQRIAKHRATRPGSWRTLVIGDDPSAEIQAALHAQPPQVLLLDCLAMLVSGALFMHETVPTDAENRAYRDALGRANQRIAAHADAVYFLVAGLPQRFK